MLSNISKSITSPIERLTSPLSRRNTGAEEQPWHTAFPAPRHQAENLPDVEKEDVLALLKEGKKPGERGGFLLVDVRRNDHEVRIGLVIGALGSWISRPANLSVREGRSEALSISPRRASTTRLTLCTDSARLLV